MKTHLLFKDQDFPWESDAPSSAEALIQDMELTTLFSAMAGGDQYLYETSAKVVLASVDNADLIAFRQRVLNDCLIESGIIKELYTLAVETVDGVKHVGHFFLRDQPGFVLSHSIELLEYFVPALKTLRALADDDRLNRLQSDGMAQFTTMLTSELDDDYFALVSEHLKQLRFRSGVIISARLGLGNHGKDYVLRSPGPNQPGWWQRFTGQFTSGNSLTIADRDEAGARALSDLQSRGINLVANALAQSTDQILSFFRMMRAELAFYMGCINLRDRLADSGRSLCYPTQSAPGHPLVAAEDLCDVGLALRKPHEVVGNDVQADGRSLILITGANQGGKSTFLRSLGVAQLMFQCGMFVTAKRYSASAFSGIFTHYKREEDSTMSSGKLDEELARMGEIVNQVHPGCVVLFNESFAATNEREGSEIARQIVRALRESGVSVWFVTHLFDFAHSLYEKERDAETAVFLRAERQETGVRTFHVIQGEPLPTSYGKDIYEQIFNERAASPVGAAHSAPQQDPPIGTT